MYGAHAPTRAMSKKAGEKEGTEGTRDGASRPSRACRVERPDRHGMPADQPISRLAD
jgi:hypothetical protein